MFYEVQFAGEEVFKREKLAVSANGFVGFLFKRKFDVEGKAVLATCPCLSGAHDAFAPACDDHVARLLHQLAEFVGSFIGWSGGMGTSRPENRYFFCAVVWSEDLVRIPNFAHDSLKLLQVAQTSWSGV